MTNRKARYTAMIVGCMAVVTLGAGGVYLVRGFLNAKVEPPKKVVQEVRIIRPPPPPPDEPPPPPPPEEEVDLPEPEPQPEQSNDPPPGEQLGIDAEGTGAGDGFGLLGRPGGRDLLASGGSGLAWYSGLVKNEILGQLEDEQRVRSGSYSVVVRLWVARDGKIEKAELAGSSGDKDRDHAIQNALARIDRISQAPPANTPQPLTLRIVSRA